VTIGRVPDAVTLLAPENQATLGPDSARFHWRRSQPGVNLYWFELAVDSSFMFSRVDTSSTDTTTLATDLQANRRHWWRVRARNGDGWGPFSEVWSVDVTTTTVVDVPEVPAQYVLRQNYPNPFNPTTTIEFDLPALTEVRLEVFTVLGERVAVLASGPKPAGRHREQFATNHLPSGVYLARLTTPEYTHVIRMILMK
jgi:hypothetical protein